MHYADVAAALVAKRRIERPSELDICALAYGEGACVVWVGPQSADARITRYAGRAYIAVPDHLRGTPRALFSVAHDLGHHLLHGDVDAAERAHGSAASGRAFGLERQADGFAGHVLVPTALAKDACAIERPSLADVRDLADEYGVSLTVAARRWAELSPVGCAFLEARRGRVKWVTRSASFRGTAVQGRVLEDGTLALDRTCGWSTRERHRSHRRAWGAARAGSDVIEECIAPRERPDALLVWLSHA